MATLDRQNPALRARGPLSAPGNRIRRPVPPAPAPALAMAAPDLDERDVDAVTQVIRSQRLALGPVGPAFEQAMARYVGVEHAVGVSSGTAALHLVVKCLGLGPRDEVLVPSFTFAASVNALLYEGVRPVFVDLDPETLNLDVGDLEHRITHRTRAIMAVDVFGVPADWDRLTDLASRHNLKLIDDCCEGLGSAYHGRRLGSFGEAGVFAFYPNKQITTGEGGMIVTNRADLAELARSYANQGRGAMGAWLQHDRLGFNYRLDEMSAALGMSQLNRIDELLARRAKVAALYTERLAGLTQIQPPRTPAGCRNSWFVYAVTLEEGLDRDLTMVAMDQEGVPARGYFAPIHTQPYIRARFGDLAGTLPVTEAMAKRTLALPFHNRLTEREIDRVVAVLRRSLR